VGRGTESGYTNLEKPALPRPSLTRSADINKKKTLAKQQHHMAKGCKRAECPAKTNIYTFNGMLCIHSILHVPPAKPNHGNTY